MLHLNDVLTDVYGKNGRMILSGICDGQDIDHIVSKLTHNVRKKADQIRAIFKKEVPQYVLIRLKSCLEIIESVDKQITILENEIFRYANKYHKREMDILLSCPGIGELSAATLIAEICDFHDFSSGDKLASWLGIVPNVYQSADKYYNGRITKRGSRVARWILTQVAQAAARTKKSRLKMFFNSKVKTIGFQRAIIALARKIVTI
ncbi:IS110 family transposase, partial [Methanosalsum natronophilum]